MIRPIRVCTFCCCVLRSRLCFCHIISLFFLMFPFCSVFFSAPFSWFSALFFLFFLSLVFYFCFGLLFSVLFFSVIYLSVYIVFFQKLYLFFSCIVTELFVLSFFLSFFLLLLLLISLALALVLLSILNHKFMCEWEQHVIRPCPLCHRQLIQNQIFIYR